MARPRASCLSGTLSVTSHRVAVSGFDGLTKPHEWQNVDSGVIQVPPVRPGSAAVRISQSHRDALSD